MKNVKVLIADDHEEFRADLRRFLATQQGIEIIGEAADGVETVSLADRLHPDLILLDINMPRMSGMEVAQYIKEHSPDIKIVMVTIHEEETYQTVADYFGVDGFVSKNSLKQNLLRVLRHVVN